VAAEPFTAVAAPWDGETLSLASPQVATPRASPAGAEAAEAPLPAWAGCAPHWRADAAPDEPDLPAPLAPSRPDNASLGPVPAAASPLAPAVDGLDPFRRGQLAHALLQHLPALPRGERDVALARYLARPGLDLAPEEAARLSDEVRAVLDHPDLAALFGPEGRAEVPLTGVVAGLVVGGLVDRLAVLDDRVMVADYKTNRTPPDSPDRVPVLYLRQMAAYRAVLAGAFPSRRIVCALVWTSTVSVMPLPDSLLDRHAPGAARAA
jgi:ATP-dependent helicase/nuclease subunit A